MIKCLIGVIILLTNSLHLIMSMNRYLALVDVHLQQPFARHLATMITKLIIVQPVTENFLLIVFLFQ
nr:MAG TPA: hypothetical protein [Caudoviricetes sp.]